ncbi:hypothetical protein IJG22_00350 [Candidatus Saccharibacteria bacterium]|nr:hypothetical protein [Candidatus Saccharibacteria bacterium]
MRKRAYGFTLIEVSIFLAVTGALFVAVTVGVQNSIYQQRYNDTVNGFADFLGNLYSEVLNVQSTGNGRHAEAIYGKLVTFGESGLGSGEAEGRQIIHTYDVLAEAANSWNIGNEDTLTLMYKLNANVIRKTEEDTYELVGVIEDYTPRWSARIQKNDAFEDYVGALLIVRNAKSGTIQTFAMDDKAINVRDMVNDPIRENVDVFGYENDKNYLYGEGKKFSAVQVDFCVNPNGTEASSRRADVRIIPGAHDASGVEIIPFDSEANKCKNE